MPDVIAFGEVMVRLAPPHFQRLEQARSLDIEIGGAELNTAAGLVRLGRSAAWVSRLPDNPLGKLVANRVREIGVSDQFVQFDPDARCGLYFLEFGASPRASSILYDRKDSADRAGDAAACSTGRRSSRGRSGSTSPASRRRSAPGRRRWWTRRCTRRRRPA